MSIDKVSTIVEQALAEAKSNPKPERGERGVVGEASASDLIKRLWHETHFHKVEPTGKQARRRVWARNKNCPSLKQFVRAQVALGNKTAIDWVAQKNGALELGRSDKNVARVASERTASMASRRKKSAGKPAKATAEATAVATATKAK